MYTSGSEYLAISASGSRDTTVPFLFAALSCNLGNKTEKIGASTCGEQNKEMINSQKILHTNCILVGIHVLAFQTRKKRKNPSHSSIILWIWRQDMKWFTEDEDSHHKNRMGWLNSYCRGSQYYTSYTGFHFWI